MKTNPRSFFAWLTRLVLSLGLLTAMPLSPTRSNGPVEVQPVSYQAYQPAGLKPTPVLAYYYIWYDSNSWDRAKMDLPLEGRYTSDDRAVMRQHILWAKAAGIEGFIVSWKSTDVLNRRLEQLADLAEAENFKLVVIYQGLDFDRNPLPVDRISSDLDVFIQRFAQRPAFNLYPKPLVIWSGTWKFSPQEVAQVTQSRRADLLILASERNTDGYQRLANFVDGNAYYWSSVNPDTYPGYQDKLVEMAQAVHRQNGLWIAPAAPGFNAHMIGGTSTVERKDGQTFRSEINTALASSPDALGIISWNEFSENSYIEPSQTYGSKYLDILSEINHLPAPSMGEFNSSEPLGTYPEVLPASRAIALGGLALILIVGGIIIARRHI